MKGIVAYLCAFAALWMGGPAESSEATRAGVSNLQVLFPGQDYQETQTLDSTLWSDFGLLPVLCLGDGVLQIQIQDPSISGAAMLGLLSAYGSGIQDWDWKISPGSLTLSAEVQDYGVYYIVTGYSTYPGSFPATCSVTVTFSEEACTCVIPHYNPGEWNDYGPVQYNNNCYNFANDEITMTFAQPGRACGDMFSFVNCEEVYRAAACDGLVPVADGSQSCPPGMHKVYLVVWPSVDYHWYRQDSSGMWSHKMGSTEATNRDNSGRLILNPQWADTGSYTSRCGYFCACGDCADIF